MSPEQLLRAEREQTRWRILVTLDAGRPTPVSEHLLLQVLGDIKLSATPASLRRELDYLESRGLVDIERTPHNTWLAELTRLGVDLVEYTVPCEPGIARPVRG